MGSLLSNWAPGLVAHEGAIGQIVLADSPQRLALASKRDTVIEALANQSERRL
jgi:hypothetical protein